MKKLESKNLNLLYKDGVCRFYCVGEATKTDKKPIVFINGQLDHRLQAMETATNATKKSCFQYSWYYEYDDQVHTPYIWVYDYPIYKGHKNIYSTDLFTISLYEALKQNKLSDVDIMGQSVGGIIGMKASRSELVDKVVAIHPPIQSSPLANKALIRSKYLTWKQKMIAIGLNIIVDDQFAFQQENATGYPKLEHEINLDKIKVTGSSIYGLSHLSGIEKEFSDFVYYLSGMPNDGVVCFDSEILRSRGFDVIVDEKPVSHLRMSNNTSYTGKLYQDLILRKK